jgi:hypothetical protein
MGVGPHRLSPFISNRTKTLLVAGAVTTLAVAPAWRSKSSASKLGASASVVAQAGQWVPQSPVPFLSSGVSRTVAPNYNTYHSGRVSSIAVDPRDPSRWLVGVGNGGVRGWRVLC